MTVITPFDKVFSRFSALTTGLSLIAIIISLPKQAITRVCPDPALYIYEKETGLERPHANPSQIEKEPCTADFLHTDYNYLIIFDMTARGFVLLSDICIIT